VDLAGSERVKKSGAQDAQNLREARYINTSLFFLEMVIVALHEKATKGRTHIPYRNSMMTSLLRDRYLLSINELDLSKAFTAWAETVRR
jgi:kinesin family protein 6/9